MDGVFWGLVGLTVVGVGYLLRNENRLTRIESKLDEVMRKMGLDP